MEVLVPAFAWGVVPVLHKNILKEISGPSLMIISGVIYTIGIFIIAIFHSKALEKDFQKIRMQYIFMITLTTILGMIISNYIYFRVLEKEKSYIVSALIATSPLITLFIAVIVFNEEVSLKHLIGVLSIILGIYLLV
jgi:uncharacterized membrane protein